METSARHLKWLCATLLLVIGSNAPTVVVATDETQAPELNVWVADAPADIVIKQLAEMTGRELVIDGALSGRVSGRFKGSVRDALSAIAEQTPVLFDISDVTLSATDDQNKIRSSIVAGDNPLDEATRNALVSNLTPGNEIEFRDNEVIVSGHPVFVRRTAMTVTAAFADTEHFRLNGIQSTDAAGTLEAIQDQGAEKVSEAVDSVTVPATDKSALAAAALGDVQAEGASTPGTLQDTNSSGIDNANAVADAGSQELVKDMRDTLDTGEQIVAVSSQVMDDSSQRVVSDVPVDPDTTGQALSQTEQDGTAAVNPDAAPTSAGTVNAPTGESGRSTKPTREFQWVTDIPGFDTF